MAEPAKHGSDKTRLKMMRSEEQPTDPSIGVVTRGGGNPPPPKFVCRKILHVAEFLSKKFGVKHSPFGRESWGQN